MDFFSNVSRTIGRSIVPVIYTFVGVLPVFIGANFLGICIFWRSEWFGSYSDGMFTLFAAMNGDNLANVYSDLSFYRFIWANIFLYTYILFSIAVILNIFTIIIEEGYITAKYSGKFIDGEDEQEKPWDNKIEYHEQVVMGREKKAGPPESQSHLELAKIVKYDLKSANLDDKDIKEVSKSDDDSSSKSFVGSDAGGVGGSMDTDAFWDILSNRYNDVLTSIDKLKA